MTHSKRFEVIIVGGSYAGLSAAMALGRSIRKVLIMDSGKPCNRQTPHSHNFITQDGQPPKHIWELGKEQVLQYDTVQFYNGLATDGRRTKDGFEISTQSGDTFTSDKLLFTTGIMDEMLSIKGFSACWGISVLHCPYCHGYEIRGQTIGLFGNGDIGFEFCRLISNWSKDLILFTNGKSTLTDAQRKKIQSHSIKIVEKEISELEHQNGKLVNVVFADGSKSKVTAIFAKLSFKQHCDIPQQLGCDITEQGFIKIDDFQKTNIHGVYAAGDNTTLLRAVSTAVASGTKAGAVINKEWIDEQF